MTILEDNSVIPSYLGWRNQGAYQDPGHQTNVSLRSGEVREIVYPNDRRNVNGRFIEYVVEVQEKDDNGPGTTTLYANCVLANPLGSVADILRYTLRASDGKTTSDDGVGVGAKVLILCVNGETSRGVIVSGLRDTGTDKDGTKQQGADLKDDGHNLFFEFNGAQFTINKDGELRVQFRGATNVDGTLADGVDKSASGSGVFLNKEGSVTLYSPAGDQSISIDHKNKVIDVVADQAWRVRSNKDVLFEADGLYSFKGKSTCSIEVQDHTYIKSTGVYTGDATDYTILGSTYRRAEAQLNNNAATLLNNLGGLITTAASNLQIASTLFKTPVTGPIVGSVPLQVATVALQQAGPLFVQLAGELTRFEGGAAGYLSKKNKSD